MDVTPPQDSTPVRLLPSLTGPRFICALAVFACAIRNPVPPPWLAVYGATLTLFIVWLARAIGATSPRPQPTAEQPA